MGRIDLEATEAAEVAPRRRHFTRIAVLTVALVGGSALLAVPAIAESGSDDLAGKVIVCESGVVDHGDGIQTSSASVELAAVDAPVPDGCRAELPG